MISDIKQIFATPQMKAFGNVIGAVAVVIGIAYVINMYYSARKTQSDYILNKYKLMEYKKQYPDFVVTNY